MSRGADRYYIKQEAGWDRTRPDGSDYSPETDAVSHKVECWACARLGGIMPDEEALLSGDLGYDFVVRRGRTTLRVDAVHAGFQKETKAPRGRDCCLICNLDSPKLYHSHVLVLVGGPPFEFFGGLPTVRFLAVARLVHHGYGRKLSIAASELWSISELFGRSR